MNKTATMIFAGLGVASAGAIAYMLLHRKKTATTSNELNSKTEPTDELYQKSILSKKSLSLQDIMNIIKPTKDAFGEMQFKTSPLVVDEIKKQGYSTSKITADRQKFWDDAIKKYGKAETKNMAQKMTLTTGDEFYLSSKGIFL